MLLIRTFNGFYKPRIPRLNFFFITKPTSTTIKFHITRCFVIASIFKESFFRETYTACQLDCSIESKKKLFFFNSSLLATLNGKNRNGNFLDEKYNFQELSKRRFVLLRELQSIGHTLRFTMVKKRFQRFFSKTIKKVYRFFSFFSPISNLHSF